MKLFLLLSFFLSAFPMLVSAEQSFVVTAYYSPLPGQAKYLKGSYEADIRLNGNGTHGASGTPVFPGMIAAPKKYAFGTQLYLQGFGTGNIQDRGGAIVSAGDRGYAHDRIDIWMGHGDEGLNRALQWGKRTVSGAILPQQAALSVSSIDTIALAASIDEILPQLKKEQDERDRLLQSFQSWKSFKKGTRGEGVVKLQKILVELGYFAPFTPGVFDTATQELLWRIQLEENMKPNGLCDSATITLLVQKYFEYTVRKRGN